GRAADERRGAFGRRARLRRWAEGWLLTRRAGGVSPLMLTLIRGLTPPARRFLPPALDSARFPEPAGAASPRGPPAWSGAARSLPPGCAARPLPARSPRRRSAGRPR